MRGWPRATHRTVRGETGSVPEWTKDTWCGNYVVYMGDGRNSATFYGPEAEQKRDEYFAAFAPQHNDSQDNTGEANEHRQS